MIDPQTGYNDEVVCGCKPCPDCDGEGGWYTVCDHLTTVHGFAHCAGYCKGHESTCESCNGTGKDSSDCEIPAHSQEVTA